ncbi:MAG TPA: sigma-70 family RNA polymerase sigma factor [Fimbriimonadales bacterium]|nr:sigma-70 family RNA polymerase sigma factor [Fimbriimonadales bacterium]
MNSRRDSASKLNGASETVNSDAGAIGLSRITGNDPDSLGVDFALLKRCKTRDVEAFGLLVDRYQARVLGYIRRMVPHREEAEDLAQEVFLRAFKNIHRFDGRASLATWFFKIANNLCIDRARHEKRKGETLSIERDEEAFLQEITDERWNPETRAIAEEMKEIVEIAIQKLSEKLRSVLLLHDAEGLSYEEIAQVLRIPVGTVKSRLFLAREHLQDAIKQYL